MKTYLILFLLLIPLTSGAQHEPAKCVLSRLSGSLISITHGDMDNDGLIDMIFADDWNISWTKNIDGVGNWSVNQLIDNNYLYTGLRQIQVVDIDLDGFLDVIVAYKLNSNMHIKWYKNELGKKFSEPFLIATKANIYVSALKITCGDMDNDGDSDIIVSITAESSGISDAVLMYNNENAGEYFTPGISFALASNKPSEVILAQMNDDEYLDIVLLHKTNLNNIVVYKNIMGETVERFIINPAQATIKTIAIGDIDGDGLNDILATSGSSVFWYANMGNYTFSPSQTIATSINVSSSKLIDIDGDSDLDYIYSAYGGNFGYFKNLGQGLSNVPQIIHNTLGVSYYDNTTPIAFDFDIDGDLDIVIMGEESYYNKRALFENDGTGQFEVHPLILAPLSIIKAFAFGDIDGDEYIDIVGAEQNPQNNSPLILFWCRFNPEINMYEKPISINTESNNSIWDIAISDINNDGRADVLYNSLNTSLKWQFNEGSGIFSSPYGNECPIGNFLLVNKIVPVDITGNGLPDIVMGGGYGIVFYKNLGGNNGFQSCQNIFSQSVTDFVLEDFNNDGFIDIFPIIRESNQIGWITNNYGTASLSFSPWQHLVSVIINSNHSAKVGGIAFGDPNEDGLKNMFVMNTSGFRNIILYKNISSSTPIGPLEIIQEYISELSNLTIMDYNFDGVKDIIYRNNDKLTWNKNNNIYPLYLSSISSNVEYELFVNPLSIKFTSVDEDNDLDLVVLSTKGLYYKENLSNSGSMTAKAFYDENENGSLDSSEQILYHFAFDLSPAEASHTFVSIHQTSFLAKEGGYTISSIALPGWTLTSDSTQEVFFSQDTTITTYFGYKPDSIISSLDVSLTSGPTRCGFTVPFWLNYSNEGSKIENGFIKLFSYDNLATLLDAQPPADTIINDTLYWHFERFGISYHNSILLNFQMPDFNSLGDTLRIGVSIFSEDNDSIKYANSYDFQSVIRCAYDPNDKLVTPPGYMSDNYVLFDQHLDYTIRFQNTGTDTAFNVVIIDQLNSNLDWNSFRLLTSSHEVRTNINQETGVIRFEFLNILLPDSAASFTLSQGFVKYRILPKVNLPEGVQVHNRAEIYFDYNPPVITNTTRNTFVSNYPIIIHPELRPPICYGDSSGSIILQTTAIQPVSYNWSNTLLNGHRNENILPAGLYNVTVTDGTGGTRIDSFLLNDPPILTAILTSTPQSSIAYGTATCIPQGGTPPYVLKWATIPTQYTNTAINLLSGTYSVEIWDFNNCYYSDSIEIEQLVSAHSLSLPSTINVYPNPSSGNFTIEINNQWEPFEITITNISGQLVFYKKLSKTNSHNMNINGEQFPAGVYIISVNDEAGTVHKNLIITK